MENSIIKQITDRLEALIDGSSLFLVDMKIKPTNNIKIYLDGDTGVTIDAVSKINRSLYKQLEESEMFPDGDFSLEVSSAGIDEPLKFFRQYVKNIGRKVEVTLQDDQVRNGVLTAATETEITLEETIGKKKEVTSTAIPFSDIKKTVVQVSF